VSHPTVLTDGWLELADVLGYRLNLKIDNIIDADPVVGVLLQCVIEEEL
jgi:hypothetical protein